MTDKTEIVARRVIRLVEIARAFNADPNDDAKRLAFLKATFNLDQSAAQITALAEALEPFAKVGQALTGAALRYDVSGPACAPLVSADDFRAPPPWSAP